MFGFKKKNKIIAVVKFNDREAFVMKYPIKLEYTKYDNRFILGTDGVFVSVYYKDRCGPNWKAFGGRKFDLQLTDGKVEHCYGQWWSGGEKKAEEILNSKIIPATAQSLERLKECYVFVGYSGTKKEIEKLRKKYKGKVYEYDEYEGLITPNLYRKQSASKKYKSVKLTKHDIAAIKKRNKEIDDMCSKINYKKQHTEEG